ncbi:hypothetical protein M427DRAFT_151820 [Gonapodya prolifera JEL478]|uniref:Uncharacterized protein n=1 Tax=Gonapodya prolifera (strain JEL478) TaxID=1344416 RepID=A0A139AUW7_GONPJ|nr:hypothetical protein M427DRAFT_151820 [Gonapodya prolifera JEL478]|eukprot:KXS20494.1 hypothetical protein M427DRAFT_151820 [Gonapodya prolifera JEL478]
MNGGGGDAGTDIHLPSAGLDVGYFDQVGPGMGGHGGVGYPNPAERDLLATPDGATLALDWHLYQPSPLPRSQPASDSGPTAGLAAPLTPPTRDSHQHDPSVVYLVCYSYGRGDPTLNASHPVVSLLEHIPITPATSVAILHPRGLPSQVPPTSPTLSSPHYPCDVALAAGLVRRKAKEAAVVLVGLGREGVGMAARYVSERGGDGRMVEVFVGVGWQAGDWPAAGHSKEVHTWVRDVRDIVARYPALFYSSPLDLDPDAVLRPGATARDVETALIAPAYGFSTVAEYREAQGWAVVAGVGVPTLLLLSSTDPFAPPLGYPLTDLAENPNVVVATSQLGGHLGWREGWFAQNTTGVYGAGKSIKAGKRWWCKVVREVGGLAELLSYVTPILRPPRADQPLPALLPSPGLPRTLLGSSPSANHLARYIPSVWFNLIPACESHGLRGASTTDATWVLRALSLPAAVEDLEGETRRAEGAWDIDDYGADEALQPLASSQFSIASGVSTGSVIPSGRELRRLTSVSSSLGQLRRVVPGIPLAQPVSQQPGPSRRASSRSVSSMVSGGSESHLVLQTAEVWRREAGSGVTEIVTTPGGAPSPLVLPTAVATTPLSEGDGSSRNRVLMDVRPVLNFARRDSETQEELPDVSWFSDSSTPLALDLAGATNVPSPPFRRPLDRRSRSADRAMSVRTASRRSTVVPEVEAEAAAAWSAPEKHLPSETTQSMGEGSTPPATPTQTRSAKSWITNRPSSVLSMVPLSPDSRRSSLSLSRTSPCTATPRNRIFWWILVARRIVALSFIAALHQMTIWTGKGGAMERSARRLRESAVTRVREIPRYPSDALTMSAVANARSQDRTAFLRAVAVVVASGLTWVFGLQASRMMKDRADTLLAYEILHLLETAASMAVTQV